MSDINIRVMRPGDQDRLMGLIRAILSETGAQKADVFNKSLWEWQCLSPGFDTLVTVAEDGDKLVGCYHLVSREMRFFGQPRRMALLQELGVLPDYRRHGLFMKMSDLAVAEASKRGWSLTYSFPNHRSFPGFIKKQSYQHVGNASVWVRPLNPAAMLPARLPLKGLQRAASAVAMAPYNVLFPIRAADVTPVEKFTSDVDQVSSEFMTAEMIGAVRDAAFLNWRFSQKPTGEYQSWAAGRDGIMSAYLVTRRASMFGTDCLVLMDFGCLAGSEADLLRLIGARVAAERSAGAVLAVAMGMHPFCRRLGRLGFIPIPNPINPRPLRFIVRRHDDRVDDRVYQLSNWFTTLADWDVL